MGYEQVEYETAGQKYVHKFQALSAADIKKWKTAYGLPPLWLTVLHTCSSLLDLSIFCYALPAASLYMLIWHTRRILGNAKDLANVAEPEPELDEDFDGL